MMGFEPLVTVITPTYNHSSFIDRCLRSVQEQSYPIWEQIIVDDGSTDSTPEIVRGFTDDRVRYIRREHKGLGGLGEAYNTALRASRGEIVAILEGDDYWPSEKLERQVPIFRQRSRILCWGDGVAVDGKGNRLHRVRTLRAADTITDLHPANLVPAMLLDNFISPSSGIIVRRAVLERVGGFIQPSGVPFVDLPTWLELLVEMEAGESFTYIRERVVNFRSHPGQATRGYRDMVVSRAKTVVNLLSQLDPSRTAGLGLDESNKKAVIEYHKARVDLVNGDWDGAAPSFSRCLSACWALKARALLGLGSCLLSSDLFRFVPSTLRYRAFGLRASSQGGTTGSLTLNYAP